MWPECLSSIIVRVIYSVLEWTDDEGNPITTPRRVTRYRELRPSLAVAEKALWLTLDHEWTQRNPLDPRFEIDERWLKVWAIEMFEGKSLLYEAIKAAENGGSAGRPFEGLQIQVVVEWRKASQASTAVLRFAAKHGYASMPKKVIEEELARRKLGLGETRQKSALRDAAMAIAAHR